MEKFEIRPILGPRTITQELPKKAKTWFKERIMPIDQDPSREHPDREIAGVADTQVTAGEREDLKPVQASMAGIQPAAGKVRPTEDDLTAVLESIGEGFFACDGDWRFVYVNHVAERLLGIRSGEVLGKSHWEVFPPTLGTRLESEYRRAAAGEPRDFENFYEPWGRWFHNRCFPRPGGGMSVYFRDVTQHKQAEVALQKSEAQFRALFENSPEAIFFSQPDGTVESANPAACVLFGYSEQELRGLGRSGILDPEDPRLSVALQERRRTGRVQGRELTAIRKGGERFQVEVSSVILPGPPEHAFELLRDITGRKQAEQALKESEQLYRTIGESIPYGSWVTDATGFCTYTSPSFLEMTGMTMDQFQQFKWLDLLPPEDVEPTKKHWLECVQTGEPFQREHRFKSADGTLRNVLTTGRPIRDDRGTIIQWAGLNLDITDRRRAEESLHHNERRVSAIMEQVPVGVGLLDRTGRLTLGNSALQNYLPNKMMPSRDPNTIRQWHAVDTKGNLLPPEQWPGARSLRGETVLPGIEFFHTGDDGQQSWALVTTAPFRWPEDQIDGVVVAIQDITGRKRTEEELQKSSAKLEAALASMTDAVFISDTLGEFIHYNDAFVTFHKFKDKTECAKNLAEYPDILDVFIADGEPVPLDQWAVPRALRGETVTNAEYGLRRKDSGETWVGSYSFAPIRNADGTIVGSVVIGRDITEKKRSEQALTEAYGLLNTLLDQAPVGIAFFDRDLRYVRLNERLAEMNGIEAEAHIGRRVNEIVPTLAAVVEEVTGHIMATGKAFKDHEFTGETAARPGVTRHWNESWYPVRNEKDEILGFGVIVEDISDRKAAELTLERTNRVLQMLSECNAAVIHLDDEQALIQKICRIAVEVGGYRMAWVGIAQNDSEKSVQPEASAGFEAGYLEAARISWGDGERGRGPTGTAIRTGKAQIGVDFLTDPNLAQWREEALKRGYRCSIALPLILERGTRGALTIYGAEPTVFNEAQIKLLRALAENLGTGLNAIRTKTLLRQANESLVQRTEQSEGRAKGLQALAVQLIEAEENERRRIAEMLHDDLQQVLAAARMQIDWCKQSLPSASALDTVHQMLTGAIQSTRELSHELSPAILHQPGIAPALQWLARQMAERFGMQVGLDTESLQHLDCAPPVKLFMFRAIQELLFNSYKYSGVKDVQVALAVSEGYLRLVVSDSGRGFDADRLDSLGTKTGLGLMTLKERAQYIGGGLMIESAPGQGSRFTLNIPLQMHKNDPAAGPADKGNSS